ncbi:unnamed protein product [Sphenostylis stenocarpa]|uniref:Uncharacterized protein n=1 Tax=Sphenostylis stenocarpa TaxID=92480 RepID=A0AA86S6S1_9FABA|nr:unnamed protein product [Sphenostylis stenocarpa]
METGLAPGTKSIANSISLSVVIQVMSSGNTSGNSLTTGISSTRITSLTFTENSIMKALAVIMFFEPFSLDKLEIFGESIPKIKDFSLQSRSTWLDDNQSIPNTTSRWENGKQIKSTKNILPCVNKEQPTHA